MSVGEKYIQPPFYDELFIGITGLAALRGTINHGPLDSSLEPGNDGTLMPSGERATGYDFALTAEQLPSEIVEKGIDQIDIGNYSSTVIDGDVWEARAWLTIHEQIGITRTFTFHKNDSSGEITASFSLDSDETISLKDEGELTPEQSSEIINDLFHGRRYLLGLDGPSSDFARAVELCLITPNELDAHDIDLLNEILSGLVY